MDQPFIAVQFEENTVRLMESWLARMHTERLKMEMLVNRFEVLVTKASQKI